MPTTRAASLARKTSTDSRPSILFSNSLTQRISLALSVRRYRPVSIGRAQEKATRRPQRRRKDHNGNLASAFPISTIYLWPHTRWRRRANTLRITDTFRSTSAKPSLRLQCDGRRRIRHSRSFWYNTTTTRCATSGARKAGTDRTRKTRSRRT